MITDEDLQPLKMNLKKNQKYSDLFPHTPLVSNKLFAKFDLDLLFTIFYFCEDKYQRFLAAKELKSREW